MFGNRFQHLAVATAARRPLLGEIAEVDGPRETCLPLADPPPLLPLAGALGGRVLELVAGIEQQVLQMRAHAGCNVLEPFARLTAAGGTKAREVVLCRLHIAGA